MSTKAGGEPAPVLLLESSDMLVSELGPIIRFQRRGLTELWVGLGAAAIGLMFWAAPRLVQFTAFIPPDTFSTWAAWLLSVMGGFLVVLSLARRIAPCWELRAEQRCLVRGSRRVSFADIRSVDVVETKFGSTTALGLRVECAEGAVWIVPGQLESHRDAIARLAERVRAQLDAPAAVVPTVAGSPTRFWVSFALALGAIWAGSMGWLAPNVVLTHPGGSYGFRLWPLGLWIAALGVVKLPRFRGHPRRRENAPGVIHGKAPQVVHERVQG